MMQQPVQIQALVDQAVVNVLPGLRPLLGRRIQITARDLEPFADEEDQESRFDLLGHRTSTEVADDKTLADFLNGYIGIIGSRNDSKNSVNLSENTGRFFCETLMQKAQRNKKHTQATADELLEIGRSCAALPVLDHRAPDEIMGYNDNGLPD